MPGEPLAGGSDAPASTFTTRDLDARIAALESSNQWSAGMIAWTADTVAPPGFLIADGSDFDVDRYAALAVIFPSGVLPNLVDRFAVGAGGAYALLTTGGAAAVTLTAAQSGVPAHTHTASTTNANEASHTHSGTTGAGSAHSHAGVGGTQFVMATAGALGWTAGAQNITFQASTASESAHTHGFTTGAGSAHTHTATTTVNANSAAGAASPLSILNPYLALTPLVKY